VPATQAQDGARDASAPSSCIESAADARGGGGGRCGGGGCRPTAAAQEKPTQARGRAIRCHDLGRDRSGKETAEQRLLTRSEREQWFYSNFRTCHKTMRRYSFLLRVLKIGDTPQYSLCFESAVNYTVQGAHDASEGGELSMM